jgi:hypothetical protein
MDKEQVSTLFRLQT